MEGGEVYLKICLKWKTGLSKDWGRVPHLKKVSMLLQLASRLNLR